MVSLHYTFLCTLISLCIYPTVVHSMTIPSSFSAAHKTTYLQENSPIESILKVLSSYEMDSHIELVLIGQIFTSNIIDELTHALEVLSDIASIASPLKFMHEKLIYHISIETGLETKINNIVKENKDRNNRLSSDAMGNVLSEYHEYSGTLTTLFIYHSGHLHSHSYTNEYNEHTVQENKQNNDNICPQRAFLSKNGYALLDISAQAYTVKSNINGNDHIVSETEFSSLDHKNNQNRVVTNGRSNDVSNQIKTTIIHDLATLIFRSGESIVPFPVFSSDISLLGISNAF